MKLEIIGFNIESCIAAQEAGASRIELCDNPLEGGTTPSYGFINAARKNLFIELYTMVRPRGGDFFYSDAEFEIMKADIDICKQSGCDGIVIGLLKKDGTVDKKRCRELVALAYPLGVTFHRAFDRSIDPFRALEDIIETGCERILTSGQQPKAIDGTQIIKKLIDRADDRIIIMPGSGVNAENIISLAENTGAQEFHSRAGMNTESKMNYTNLSMNESLQYTIVNKDEVKSMVELLKEYSK
jgi:copper homeostasis protein